MAEGIYTEREWRKNGCGKHCGAAVCWGAVYLRPVAKKTMHTNKLLHCCMLCVALLIAAVPVFCTRNTNQSIVFPLAVVPAVASPLAVRQVPGLSFSAPVEQELVTRTYTAEQLYRGKLLLLDDAHPLPAEAPDPATIAIATYGKGMVPVTDLTLRSGAETVRALAELFGQLHAVGVSSFLVWKGTEPSEALNKEAYTAMLSKVGSCSLERAATAVKALYSGTGREVLRQAYAVELRMLQAGTQQPDARPLEETAEGRQLLRLAWRNGFVRAGGDGEAAFCFRYVGKAHATAITYLDVSLAEYLAILHSKHELTLHDGNTTYYIQCKPVEGAYMAFRVPKGAACEASMDNTGYAVVACTIQNRQQKEALQAP